MVCNNGVQASLNTECLNEITWDALLEGNPDTSCIPGFIVEVFNMNGVKIPSSPFVTANEIDEMFIGKISHTPTGQSCQTTITVEDKLPPVINCVDTLISCFHDTTPSVLGFPEFYDNCTVVVEASYVDQKTTFNCTLTDTVLIINRQWTVVDTSENSASCTQVIYVERPLMDSLVIPPNLDNISAPPLACTTDETSPAFTGVPMYNNVAIDSVCGFAAKYSDITAPICGGSFTIYRTWDIYDACRIDDMSADQTINVMDTIPPDLICPANFTVEVPNNKCEATAYVPTPAMSDSCSTDITVSLEGSFGLIQGMTIPDLAVGEYPAICYAADACGNVSNCQFTITVEDAAPPVAVGISNTVVSLLPQGTTYLPAATFDGGSWDNCSNVSIAVRRLDGIQCTGDDSTDFGDDVPFYCCDSGESIKVELRVTDGAGNVSMVSTTVLVEDNIAPEITCPADISLDCGDDYADLTITGEATLTDNCGVGIISSADSLNLNSCNEGTVKRHWDVVDQAGKSDNCIQTITIKEQDPFYINNNDPNDPNDDIIWPKNYISTTCGAGLLPDELPAEFAYPQILTGNNCEMAAFSYADTWLAQPNNACIEILRSWTVVDWCQFNPVTLEGTWKFAQILRIQNSDPPTITSNCDFQEFCNHSDDCQSSLVEISITAEDDCNSVSELVYIYGIDFQDDGTIDLTGSSSMASANMPVGTHRIHWNVKDGCDNPVKCDYLFAVVDCQAPSPVCEPMVVEIADGAVPSISIAAIELNAGSSDNCSDDTTLEYSFSSDIADSTRSFECTEIGLNSVEVWVTDEMGNKDFCKTEIDVQDNSNACSSPISVSGTIVTNSGDKVAKVKVSLNQSLTLDSIITGTDGQFEFLDVSAGDDYSIAPFKDTKPLNGVTTYDLVLISRHILAVDPLDSPYKIIAADANRSNTVTTFDIVQIRKLILGIDTAFPSNNSWRFVDKKFQFTNPLNPFGDNFPEVVNVNNLSDHFMSDFIAIKIGDMNGSVNVSE